MGTINIIRGLGNKSLGNKYLEQYNDICNQILNFSIEKDVVKAINSSIDVYMSEEWYNGEINRDVDFYNKELSQLGINNKVEYRNEKKPTSDTKKCSEQNIMQVSDALNQTGEESKSVSEIIQNLSTMGEVSPEIIVELEKLLGNVNYSDTSDSLDLEKGSKK